MHKNKAFTLIEIMVVVAIIGMLAAFAISMMVRSRMTTNETVAIASCKTIASACQSYYSVNIPHTYPSSLVLLGGAAGGPAYIDSSLVSGLRSGYTFTYALTTPVSFTVNANPEFIGRTGNRFFYTDETGRMTAKTGGSAGPNDPSVS